MWLPPHKVAFNVPVSMTKPEIIDYLRALYGIKAISCNTYIKMPKVETQRKLLPRLMQRKQRYYQRGQALKRAIVLCEEVIPDEVKMSFA